MSDTIIASLITGFISLIVGFISGYTYCINFSKKYKQKARDNSTQIQVGDIYVDKK